MTKWTKQNNASQQAGKVQYVCCVYLNEFLFIFNSFFTVVNVCDGCWDGRLNGFNVNAREL